MFKFIINYLVCTGSENTAEGLHNFVEQVFQNKAKGSQKSVFESVVHQCCVLQVSECVWPGEHESSSEEGGGAASWETQAMEVRGQLISAPGEREQQQQHSGS